MNIVYVSVICYGIFTMSELGTDYRNAADVARERAERAQRFAAILAALRASGTEITQAEIHGTGPRGPYVRRYSDFAWPPQPAVELVESSLHGTGNNVLHLTAHGLNNDGVRGSIRVDSIEGRESSLTTVVQGDIPEAAAQAASRI